MIDEFDKQIHEANLDYYKGTIYEAVEEIAAKYPKYDAMRYYGRAIRYKELISEINTCARALRALGLKEGEIVSICSPNTPQAIIFLYAVNLAGGVASMIHPLSGDGELEHYLTLTKSRILLLLDQHIDKAKAMIGKTALENVIFTHVSDYMPMHLNLGYDLTKDGRSHRKAAKQNPYLISEDGKTSVKTWLWDDFLKNGRSFNGVVRVPRTKDDDAIILYSGGTTGTSKGIVHTNYGFNCFAKQIITTNPMFNPGDRMLSVLPIFHGFGLGVCFHSMLANGGCSVLVPVFTPQDFGRLIISEKTNFMAGVPSLYDALLRTSILADKDLSFLKGVFCGGDSLSPALKEKFDAYVAERHSPVPIREGYGATEIIAACCLTPIRSAKVGSIGVSFPDTIFKIVEPGTETELPRGEVGEIVISGPTVMRCYLNEPEETAETLRVHADGRTWLYTGDLAVMDEEDFIFFKGRSKRMIISAGYNVYPAQVESILNAHEKVHQSCVIGVPDKVKGEKVKAFVILSEGVPNTKEVTNELRDYLRGKLSKFAMPYNIEVRTEFPKTKMSKVDYRALMKEEEDKIAAKEARKAALMKQRAEAGENSGKEA